MLHLCRMIVRFLILKLLLFHADPHLLYWSSKLTRGYFFAWYNWLSEIRLFCWALYHVKKLSCEPVKMTLCNSPARYNVLLIFESPLTLNFISHAHKLTRYFYTTFQWRYTVVALWIDSRLGASELDKWLGESFVGMLTLHWGRHSGGHIHFVNAVFCFRKSCYYVEMNKWQCLSLPRYKHLFLWMPLLSFIASIDYAMIHTVDIE